eukprot:365541-Chlamydomonas_euryale.AAC.4
MAPAWQVAAADNGRLHDTTLRAPRAFDAALQFLDRIASPRRPLGLWRRGGAVARVPTAHRHASRRHHSRPMQGWGPYSLRGVA